MFEKTRSVIFGFAGAGRRSTGTAAKRTTLAERSLTNPAERTRGAVAWRPRRLAAWAAARAAERAVPHPRTAQSGRIPLKCLWHARTRRRYGLVGASAGPGVDAQEMTVEVGQRTTAGEWTAAWMRCAGPEGGGSMVAMRRRSPRSVREEALRCLRAAGSPIASSQRFRRTATACAAGMDFPCQGIFFRVRITVMDSMRHAAVGGPAAGGRTMQGPESRKARSYGTGRPGPGRRGPCSHSTAGAETVGRALRDAERLCGGAWRRAPNPGRGRLAEGRRGAVGVISGGRGGFVPETQYGTIGCRAIQVLRDASARGRLARDNCCYREPTCQIRRFRT